MKSHGHSADGDDSDYRGDKSGPCPFLLLPSHSKNRVMWFNLYRCSVYLTWLSLCLGTSTTAAVGQELIPASGAQIDADATNPFSDENQLITPGTLDRFHSPLLRPDLRINGAQSCATSNCHGGPRPGVSQPSARRGMEYQLWVENDPHAQSWRTICGDESVAIMQRLRIMDDDAIVDQAGFDNCLACHNSTKRYNESRRESGIATVDSLRSDPRLLAEQPHFMRNSRSYKPEAPASESVAPNTLAGASGLYKEKRSRNDVNSFLREGVGCSGCHGPSGQWIDTHFQYHWSPRGASDQGFVEAGDLYVRARMCASCHVGDKDRDMNHDIIAAGHPTLRYEFATFHAWQPKHWRDSEAEDKTHYEAQLWLAGQVAATDASLALLNTRAADAHTESQWPEFAAYDCASCHHNLGLNNVRRPLNDHRHATAIYSPWNDAGLRWLINYRMEMEQAIPEDFDLISALDAVKRQMEAQPKPSARAVTEATAHARAVLAVWFDSDALMHERLMFRSDRLGRVVASAAGKRGSFESWESAVQFYLAAVAARESWPGGWQGPLRDIADRMRTGLRYPDMIDISRYAKRAENGPQLNRTQAMQLGIELAGWLGPVQPETRPIHPGVIDDAEEDAPQDARRRLDQLIKEINARWEKRRGERERREAVEANAAETDPDKMEVAPRREPKTAEELLQERERETDGNTDSNDSL